MSDQRNIPAGAVERLLHQVTVGLHRRVRENDRRNYNNKPKEMEQQFQIQISGTAGSTPNFSTAVTLEFDHAYFWAPGQRHSSLEYPQMSVGAHTSPPVGIHVVVTEWLHDERNGAIIGAVVAVAAVGTGDFTGVAHVTFQGYGMLREPVANAGEGVGEGEGEGDGEELL